MADLYVVSNLELFMLFRTSSYTFGAINTGEYTIFYWFSTSVFKTEAQFYEKTLLKLSIFHSKKLWVPLVY